MAGANWDAPYSLPAAADLSASRFCFVTVNSSAQIALPTAGVYCEGVLDNKPLSGDQARVWFIDGIVLKIALAATLTAGAKVCTNAAGKAVAGSTGHIYLGKLLKGGASGDIVPMLFLPGSLGTAP